MTAARAEFLLRGVEDLLAERGISGLKVRWQLRHREMAGVPVQAAVSAMTSTLNSGRVVLTPSTTVRVCGRDGFVTRRPTPATSNRKLSHLAR